MTDTMRSVLTQGAKRYLLGEVSHDEFTQGLVLAIAESPNTPEKIDDLVWLADAIITCEDN